MRHILAIMGSLFLSGCAASSLKVALLDNEDGSSEGRLLIIRDGLVDQDVYIDKIGVNKVSRNGRVKNNPSLPEKYVSLVNTLPPPPARFILYFTPDTTDLAPGSEGMIDALARHFQARPGAEIEIIGYTDTMGDAESNLILTKKRAEEIKNKLISLGFPPDLITATGRGESELRFPTPDNTENDGNRRVEVIVR